MTSGAFLKIIIKLVVNAIAIAILGAPDSSHILHNSFLAKLVSSPYEYANFIK